MAIFYFNTRYPGIGTVPVVIHHPGTFDSLRIDGNASVGRQSQNVPQSMEVQLSCELKNTLRHCDLLWTCASAMPAASIERVGRQILVTSQNRQLRSIEYRTAFLQAMDDLGRRCVSTVSTIVSSKILLPLPSGFRRLKFSLKFSPWNLEPEKASLRKKTNTVVPSRQKI